MRRQANRLRYGPDTHRNKPNHWHHSIASTLHPSKTKKYLIFGFIFYFLFIMYKSQFFWNFNFYIGCYAWQPWNWQSSHLDQQHHRHLQRWLKAKTSALSTFNSSILKNAEHCHLLHQKEHQHQANHRRRHHLHKQSVLSVFHHPSWYQCLSFCEIHLKVS